MLTALYGTETLIIGNHPSHYLKTLSDEKELSCPDCGDPLVFKFCQHRQSHFAHTNRDCSFPFTEPESLEHESGKSLIHRWLSEQFGPSDCFIEKRIAATNQRADNFVSSLQCAVEFQCSPIKAETWIKRCSLYQSAGISSFWVLGYSMRKKPVLRNRFVHKLNPLEEQILQTYQKLIYWESLTEHFVFFLPEEKVKSNYIGAEYLFKPNEVYFKDNQIQTKHNFFIDRQKKRIEQLYDAIEKAQHTHKYINSIKQTIEAEKVLATKKQIIYIKALLQKTGKTIPYKLNGLRKEEATALIQNLKKEREITQKY